MEISITSILDNLIFGVFGSPIYFAVIVSALFLYYSIQYDIPKWGFMAFFIPMFIWLGFYYLPAWIVILTLVFIGILLGPRLIKFANA